MNRHVAPPRRIAAVRILAGLVAMSFVFGPGVAGALGVREKPIENRELSPRPDLDKGFDALDELTPWVSDRLPGRANAVQVKGLLDYYGYGDLPGTQVAQPTRVAGAGAPTGDDGALEPAVLRGKDGNLFYGYDFVSACRYRKDLGAALGRLGDLADIIRRSGRRVVFTVVPDKSSVLVDRLPGAVPRGACATDAIAAASRTLDDFSDRHWLGMRRQLVDLDATGSDAYWRTDTHWTALGGSMWVEAVVARLSPRTAATMSVEPTTATRVGDLTRLIGLSFTESTDAVRVRTGATVTEARPPDHDAEDISQTRRWTSSPAKGLLQGRTLLVGDSFTEQLLPLLRPTIAEGAFDWIGATNDDVIIQHMLESDTVVLEIAQRNLPTTSLVDVGFQGKVVAALGVSP